MFLRNDKELNVAEMSDVAEEGSFKKAEKVITPSDALGLSKIRGSALGQVAGL